MEIDVQVGDLFIVFIPDGSAYLIDSVEVTALHSGYYDDQYTGVNPEGKIIYFSEQELLGNKAYVGRYA